MNKNTSPGPFSG